jgi:hypothetical protein
MHRATAIGSIGTDGVGRGGARAWPGYSCFFFYHSEILFLFYIGQRDSFGNVLVGFGSLSFFGDALVGFVMGLLP